MATLLEILSVYALLALVLLPISVAGAAAIIWFADKVEALIAAGQEWQRKKGWL